MQLCAAQKSEALSPRKKGDILIAQKGKWLEVDCREHDWSCVMCVIGGIKIIAIGGHYCGTSINPKQYARKREDHNRKR